MIGATGLTGPIGPTGPKGATATILSPTTTYGFAASTSGFAVILTPIISSVNIQLPDAQILSPGITLGSGNTTFTVSTSGLYRIAYHINLTAAILIGSQLIIDGAPNPATIINPVKAITSFSNEIELILGAGSTIALQMFSPTFLGTAALISGGLGASVSVIRLG